MLVCLRRLVLSAWIATSIPAMAQEPIKPAANPRIMTATRQVVQFTDLESQLLKAIQKKDKAGLVSLLTDDFAIEMPNADRLAGEDWLDSVMARDYTLKKFGIRLMSVADLGDVVAVNFNRLQEATHKGAPDNGEFFIVDLWKKDGATWKLANRYVTRISTVIPKPKPTGKE